jgi:imidazolonepropionase-like amidohydrolase
MRPLMKSVFSHLLFFSIPLILVGETATLYRAKKIQATPSLFYQPGEILIENGIIKAIGNSIKSPEGCKIVEWKNSEIYPGLISPGSSLGLAEINALRPTKDVSEVGTHTPGIEAWVAVNPDSELIPVARANGITHSLTVPMGGIISGTSGLIKLHGWGTEDITIKKNVALHLWWPSHALSIPSPSHGNKSKSIKDQDKERKKRIREIDEFFDQAIAYQALKRSGDKNFLEVPSWEAMITVIEGKTPLMIHANESSQIKAAVQWAEKRNFKFTLSDARDAWKHADWLAAKKIPVIFRHIFSAPRHRSSPHDEHYKAPGILARAGVPLSIGLPLGGWSTANQRNLPYHAAHGVPYGLSREKALAAITIEPAKVCGIDHRLGTLKKGKEASFIRTSGDILDIRVSVLGMVIQGNEVSLESRHTRLNSRYLNRPKP